MSRASADQDLRWARPGPLDEPLLATKLVAPPLPDWLIARPRLLNLLTQGTQGSLTLVSAPAGSGKTMLLSSWAHAGQTPGPLAWVSLDPDDNDRVQFWAYVLAGLRVSGVVPADGLLGTLVAPTTDTSDAFLPAFVNGLAELPGPVVVVLDDLHELTSPQVLADLEFLVRHAPAQLRLVLATRSDPALPLARLRVAGAMTEVRASELAFSREEAAECTGARPAGTPPTGSRWRRSAMPWPPRTGTTSATCWWSAGPPCWPPRRSCRTCWPSCRPTWCAAAQSWPSLPPPTG